jgi:uncharacterized protein YggE
MQEAISRLEVTGEHEEELNADAVDLFVAIQGSSTFTGRAALTKAKEVAALVQASAQVGIPESAIDLSSVRAEVKSGFLGKSSSALYQLRVRVEELERLPAVLGVIAAAPQCTLERLLWRYPSDEATEARLLQAATRRAHEKARAIASALSVELASVLEAQELMQHDPREVMAQLSAPGMVRARSGSEDAELGLQIQSRIKAKRQVRLVFRLGV